jgi:hypothetical protein
MTRTFVLLILPLATSTPCRHDAMYHRSRGDSRLSAHCL